MYRYEINDDTLAILPFSEGKTRIIERNEEYIVNDTPYEVMEHSCEYFGSSLEGRMHGTKSILGTVYKAPIIVEETQKLIFFPTESVTSEKVGWISYKSIRNVEQFGRKSRILFDNDETLVINCPLFSIKNQMFRCNILESISSNRKIIKKTE